jgi:hypothetical protein
MQEVSLHTRACTMQHSPMCALRKAGMGMLVDTLRKLLGTRANFVCHSMGCRLLYYALRNENFPVVPNMTIGRVFFISAAYPMSSFEENFQTYKFALKIINPGWSHAFSCNAVCANACAVINYYYSGDRALFWARQFEPTKGKHLGQTGSRHLPWHVVSIKVSSQMAELEDPDYAHTFITHNLIVRDIAAVLQDKLPAQRSLLPHKSISHCYQFPTYKLESKL